MIRPWAGRDAEDFAEGLAGRPVDDAELAELIAFAENVTYAATVEPSASFTSQLRAELMAEAATVLVREPAAARSRRTAPVVAPRRRRRIAAAATSAILAGGGVSIAATSASALPGDFLYPVKIGLESAQTVLHRSDADRAGYDLDRATERLSEATTLIERDASPALVAATFDEFSALVEQGSARAFNDARSDDAFLGQIGDFVDASSLSLGAIADHVPADALDAHADAVTTVASVGNRLSTLCTTCFSVEPDALSDLREEVERAAVDAAPPVVDESEASDDAESTRSSESNDSNGSSSVPNSAQSGASGGESSDSTPPRLPSVPQPDLPDTEGSTGLLDPITGLLLGEDDKPSLLGRLLGGR